MQRSYHFTLLVCGAVGYVHVTISRLMKQLSEPAVLLAVQVYFPDMLALRLLSFRVPVFSSETAADTEDSAQALLVYLQMHQ